MGILKRLRQLVHSPHQINHPALEQMLFDSLLREKENFSKQELAAFDSLLGVQTKVSTAEAKPVEVPKEGLYKPFKKDGKTYIYLGLGFESRVAQRLRKYADHLDWFEGVREFESRHYSSVNEWVDHYKEWELDLWITLDLFILKYGESKVTEWNIKVHPATRGTIYGTNERGSFEISRVWDHGWLNQLDEIEYD